MLITNRLPSTTTRDNWSFTYLRNSDLTDLADGWLTITEEKGKRVVRSISSRYAVQEQTPVCGNRSFLLLKEGQAGDLDTVAGRAAADRCGEVYRVTLGGRPSCTCKGFSTSKLACKHLIAVNELIETGDVPSPFVNVDCDTAETERQFPADQMIF